MNIDELEGIRAKAEKTETLQQLHGTFYEDASDFVQQLRQERRRVADEVKSPFKSDEIATLTDDIRTAEQAIWTIYEVRLGKIVTLAVALTGDLPGDTGAMTSEELIVFESVRAELEQHREYMRDVVDVQHQVRNEDERDDS